MDQNLRSTGTALSVRERPAKRKTEAPATLHQKILADIEGKILSGHWPVGHRIPFEIDLARSYGCSRMTVNKVLTQLTRAGLIERIKRSGSFVRQPVAQSAVLEVHDIRSEVESLRLAYGYVLNERRRRVATARDRSLLEVAVSTRVLDLSCVHYAAGSPFALEDRLISLASVPDAADADFSSVPPGRWLLDKVPWSSAEHRIWATSADERVAKALGLTKGTACLVIQRRTWSGKRPVTYVQVTYPGDRHALVARFAPTT